MQTLTEDIKRNIYEVLKDGMFLRNVDTPAVMMEILSDIWDVYSMHSTGNDPLCSDLGREIKKHYLIDSDMSDDEVFLSHLRLFHISDDRFVRFVKTVLDANLIVGPMPIEVVEIMHLFGEAGYVATFKIVDGFTIFSIEPGEALMHHTIDNDILFHVVTTRNGVRSSRMDSHDAPHTLPAFVLVHNDGWNDYGCWSWFSLFYYNTDGAASLIGDVKIIKRGETDTYSVIDKQFRRLPDDFCSLGLDVSYYYRLRDIFGSGAWSIAKAMRDSACFSAIEEAFTDDTFFKNSLCRSNSSEKALREGRFLVAGYDMRQSYAFTYNFHPGYADGPVSIDFNFKYDSQPFERIISLIGENGVGKTTLLNRITDALSREDRTMFSGSMPFYSKIIVVSYSPFDHFPRPLENEKFRYSYCGLMKNDHEIYSKDEQINQLVDNIDYICRRSLDGKFLNLLEIILDTRHVAEIARVMETRSDETYRDNHHKWITECRHLLYPFFTEMSSGQLNYLLSTAAVVANIRNDALLLFDEPEQHLHPNAVTSLMNGISTLLEKFSSYAIIATHSPLIVRELVSENVFVMTRDDTMLSVARIPIECFGENVAVLNDVIFGNRDQKKRFESFVHRFVRQGYDYADILHMIESPDAPLSLTARLMIKRIIEHNSDRS